MTEIWHHEVLTESLFIKSLIYDLSLYFDRNRNLTRFFCSKVFIRVKIRILYALFIIVSQNINLNFKVTKPISGFGEVESILNEKD